MLALSWTGEGRSWNVHLICTPSPGLQHLRKERLPEATRGRCVLTAPTELPSDGPDSPLEAGENWEAWSQYLGALWAQRGALRPYGARGPAL